MTSLKERTNNMKLEDFLIALKEVQDIGAELGKKPGTVHNELQLWQIVMYLHEKGESEFAFRILIGQLTEELPSYYLPLEANSVPIIKKVGREREYLQATLHHIQHHNPSVQDVLRLRSVLKKLGMEKEILHYPDLFIE
ncbi:hypothetical protein ACQ0QQ_14040 [Lysinibacillus sphaericus]